MFKSKEVAVPTDSELSSVVKPIAISKGNKTLSFAVPFGISGIGVAMGTALGFGLGDFSPLPSILATMFTIGAGGSTIILYMEKLSAITKAFSIGGEDNAINLKTRQKARKERVLINTFNIRDNSNVEITSWQDSKNSIPYHDATHTIKQYLRKTRAGFQVEQEVVPNPETIWDLSAEALIEVYGVQEKTDSMKGIAA